MPRRPRDQGAGLFHIFVHGLWAVPCLFRDEVDRSEFLRHLAYATDRTGWTCVAYCVMTSHYHLIVGVEDGVLPVGMQIVNRRYARHFNRRHGLRGHVLFDRYGSRRIGDGLDLLDTFTYVARNPVDVGLCADPAGYSWSSYAGTVGRAEGSSFVDSSRLLTSIGRFADDPVAALRSRVERSELPVPGTGWVGSGRVA